MSRIYLTEHRTCQGGRVGLVQIHAETWDEAERIARSVEIPGASQLKVIGYQEGEWDDEIPYGMDLDKARRGVETIMREVEAIIASS